MIAAAVALGCTGGNATRANAQTESACRYQGNQRINSNDRQVGSLMTVPRNRSCGVFLNNMTVSAVETPPSHGRIEHAGGNWRFVPQRDYVGEDSATLVYDLRGRRIREVVNIRVVP